MHIRQIGAALVVLSAGCGPGVLDKADGGGVGNGDARTGGGDSGFPLAIDAAACVANEFSATEQSRPVDIIWVIDNSGSMDAEERRVQDNMNAFATRIAASGIDYHVVVIADTGNINVPPPLGGSPEFLAVNRHVDSNNPLEIVIATYPMYQAFLRPGAVRHFVAVTDDESDWSASQFESAIAALVAPGFPDGFVFHAVVAEAPPFFPGPCLALSAAAGDVYIQLQEAHGGVFFSLCSTNWSPLFDTLATSVTANVSLPCFYDLPNPGPGMTLDFQKVNFIYTPTGGAPAPVPQRASATDCGGAHGWYYDDAANPTAIILCPATCTVLEADPTGTVEVSYGCATIIE